MPSTLPTANAVSNEPTEAITRYAACGRRLRAARAPSRPAISVARARGSSQGSINRLMPPAPAPKIRVATRRMA